MHSIDKYQAFFNQYANNQILHKEPQNLYNPIKYILSLGGKRIRPILALMTAEIFHTNYKKALPVAMAVEIFHNFSLVHDDIMDAAPLRRGMQTVHTKWNIKTGILSGDAMLILAYQYFEQFEPAIFIQLAKLFSKTAIEVCEGQQWDIDFEIRNNVTIPEYLKMIQYKTAVLLGATMKMGAIVAETSDTNAQLIYDFGLNLGIAFQLLDDYLDAFGNPKTFGKQIGGDIIENKKTYLYLIALEKTTENDRKQLLQYYQPSNNNSQIYNTNKINTVKEIFIRSGASESTQNIIQEYTIKAIDTLNQLDIEDERKQLLENFGKNLMNRTS